MPHPDIKGALTHKIGPLPGGVWAAIAVVAIVVVVKRRGGSTSSSTASQTDPGAAGALQTAGGLLGSGGGGGGGGGDVGAGAASGSFDSGGSDGSVGSTSSGDVASSSTDPTPVFVPIPDPSATVFPDPNPAPAAVAPPPDLIQPLPGGQLLDVTSSGVLVGTVQAPTLQPGQTAADLYHAVGLNPSDPYTLTPHGVSPQDATQTLEVAIGQEARQAQAVASKTHQAVAV